jgi:hypothetical protein
MRNAKRREQQNRLLTEPQSAVSYTKRLRTLKNVRSLFAFKMSAVELGLLTNSRRIYRIRYIAFELLKIFFEVCGEALGGCIIGIFV